MSEVKPKIIFFGNGALAEYALAVLERECQVIFHAHDKSDLEEAVRLKKEDPSVHGVLASFGVLIPSSVLETFEPEGILNVHPSLLPLYRGASPIESAILDGCDEFGVSVMKLVKAMDAGPIYYQKSFSGAEIAKETGIELAPGAVPPKEAIYKVLAEAGAEWIVSNLSNLPTPVSQDDLKATFCSKFEKKDGILDPASDPAEVIYRKIVAFQGFPKAKYAFFGKNCAILEAHIAKQGETALLPLPCSDGQILSVDRLQPDGSKPMDAKAFLNGVRR